MVVAKRTGGAIIIVAVALAGAVPGCGAFSAYRACDSPGCPEDQLTTVEIRARLAERPHLLGPNRVYVATRDAVVYLSGQVATPLQRTNAE
jgi:osmotically-inducible protein OsmY